jgi:UDP-GlcNAc:undecaprenyl-phosphate GlcNAc-1-phosphate transferase
MGNFWTLRAGKRVQLDPPLKPENPQNALIYGAGRAGELALQELNNNPRYNARPIGFIDDNEGKWERFFHGLPVFGGRKRIAELVQEENVSAIYVTIMNLDDKAWKEIKAICDDAQVPVKRLKVSFE